MATDLMQCPYCNASLPPAAANTNQTRVTCPRCGDSFPNRWQPPAPTAIRSGTPGPTLGELPGVAPMRISNAVLARCILGGMVCLALIGLTYALTTVDWRRSNDLKKVTSTPRLAAGHDPVKTVAPGELAGLGYLPADCAVVGGLHVAQLLDHPDGQKLVDALRAKKSAAGLEMVQAWTGLKLADIDHVAFGFRPHEAAASTIVVIRTRQPYANETVEAAVKPAVPAFLEGKPGSPVYRFQQDKLKRMLWCRDERTLVIVLSLTGVELTDLDKLPASPRTGAIGLPAALTFILEKRLARDSFLWTVGDLTQAKKLLSILAVFPQVPIEVGQLVSRLDTFGAGLRWHKGVTLLATLQCSDEPAARELQKFLDRPAPPGVKTTLFGPLNQQTPVKTEAARWIDFQAQMDVERAVEIIINPNALIEKKN